MMKNTRDINYKIVCKRCGWVADEAATLRIRHGKLIGCRHCCNLPKDAISDKDKKRKVMTFLQNHQLAVIATHNKAENRPESALIAFVEDEHFCLYFQTGSYTRKAKNLNHNPHVSVVIGLTLEDLATIQYEGRAELLQDPLRIAECKKRFVKKKSPTTSEHFERPEAVFYKITPTWIRFSDDTKGNHSSVIVLLGDTSTGKVSQDFFASYTFDHKGQCIYCGVNSSELGPCNICIFCDAKMGGEGAKLLAERGSVL